MGENINLSLLAFLCPLIYFLCVLNENTTEQSLHGRSRRYCVGAWMQRLNSAQLCNRQLRPPYTASTTPMDNGKNNRLETWTYYPW